MSQCLDNIKVSASYVALCSPSQSQVDSIDITVVLLLQLVMVNSGSSPSHPLCRFQMAYPGIGRLFPVISVDLRTNTTG